MSLATSLIEELDDAALDQLAALLAPRLAATVSAASGDLTPRQAAGRVGLHERTVRRALTAQTLTGTTIAGRWRITPGDLDAWIARGAPTHPTASMTNARRSASSHTAGAAAIAAPHSQPRAKDLT